MFDWIKFVCVAAMIFVHAHVFFISDGNAFAHPDSYLAHATIQYLFVGLFVMLLPVLAGATFRKENELGLRHVGILAGMLFLAGLGMNVLAFGSATLFSWNVLQLVAVSFLGIALVMRFFSWPGVVLASGSAIFFAEFLRAHFTTTFDPYWKTILLGSPWGFVIWPLFPWFGVVGFGFLYFHLYLESAGKGYARLMSLGAVGVGTILLLGTFVRKELLPIIDPYFFWGPSFFQPQTGFVLGILGLFLVLVGASSLFFAEKRFSTYSVVAVYSRAILPIYIYQMVVSARLADILKKYVDTSTPSIPYALFIIFMLVTSYFFGLLVYKLWSEKRLSIVLRKVS